MKTFFTYISIIGLLILSNILFAADPKVTFSPDGKKMIYPDKDGIPDADISGIVIELTNVPPEAQFMVGKVFRGYFSHMLAPKASIVGYLILTKWSADSLEFFTSKSRSRSPALNYTIVCPPKLTSDFSCRHRDNATNDALGKINYRFSIKDNKPLLETSDGGSLTFEEVARLPETLLRK